MHKRRQCSNIFNNFCSTLVALILGGNCVKGLKVTKIAKQIKFEGVWMVGVSSKTVFSETIIQKIFEINSCFHGK